MPSIQSVRGSHVSPDVEAGAAAANPRVRVSQQRAASGVGCMTLEAQDGREGSLLQRANKN